MEVGLVQPPPPKKKKLTPLIRLLHYFASVPKQYLVVSCITHRHHQRGLLSLSCSLLCQNKCRKRHKAVCTAVCIIVRSSTTTRVQCARCDSVLYQPPALWPVYISEFSVRHVTLSFTNLWHYGLSTTRVQCAIRHSVLHQPPALWPVYISEFSVRYVTLSFTNLRHYGLFISVSSVYDTLLCPLPTSDIMACLHQHVSKSCLL